jgi:hypothetical protein
VVSAWDWEGERGAGVIKDFARDATPHNKCCAKRSWYFYDIGPLWAFRTAV